MKSARFGWWFLCLGGWLPLPIASFAAQPSMPFVQRVSPDDFRLLETNNDLALSPASQLVICFTNVERAGAVERALALQRTKEGKWQLAYLAAVPPRKPGQFRREECELDPAIARNVLLVFRHLLGSNVYPPTGALHPPTADDDAWIFLRDDRAGAAGVTSNRALQRTQGEDVGVYRDLLAGLVGIFVAQPEERDRMIMQLDRFSTRYVELKKLARN